VAAHDDLAGEVKSGVELLGWAGMIENKDDEERMI